MSEKKMVKKGVSLFFVRHGETYLNRYNKVQGWANAPLTPEGIEDVQRSGRGLKDIHFDAIYTSDLSRTSDTAEIILYENEQTDPQTEIHLMPEFREVFFGSFEGEYGEVLFEKVTEHLNYSSIEEMFEGTNQFERMQAIKEIDPHGHAEDFMEFWLRAQKGLIHVVENHRDSGENILIVAHGMTIHLLLENLVPQLDNPDPLLNASVSEVKYVDGLFRLERYGDVSHFVDAEDKE